MRRALAAALCAVFLVQSTGAADLAPALARGMMLPPPGRMAPMPPAGAIRPAKPAGESWLASARVVARWTRERIEAAVAVPAAVEEMPSAEALAALAAIARNQAVAVASLPAPEPPADRMLIAMEGRRVLASGLAAQISSVLRYRSGLLPIRPSFIGRWVGKGDVRARVDYLKPLGVTRGEANGFRVKLADGYERLLPTNRGAIPESLMQELPLYFAGDSVDLEVRLRNDGPEALTDLRVAAVQEDHTASGAPGAPLSSPVLKTVPSLAPGQTVVLRWRIKLSAEGREAVNFEQTHLRVLGKDPAGGEKVHLDEAQAGIVDPPGAP